MSNRYDRAHVSTWLAALPVDPVELNIITLAVTTPEVEKALEAFFAMSTWERCNALYGLAQRTEKHVRLCAKTAALSARAEDSKNE